MSGETSKERPVPIALRATKCTLCVADLDRTYAFYRLLGFELEGGAAAPDRPAPLSDALLKLMDVPAGAHFRKMRLTIPGRDSVLEVTEFSNMELRPEKPRRQDPGAVSLGLVLRDLDKALALMRKEGAETAPAETSNPGGNTIIDPDGYYLVLGQGTPGFLKIDSPSALMTTRWQISFVVEDAENAARFYRDSFFGCKMMAGGWGPRPGAQIRGVFAFLYGPGGLWNFYEFKDIPRTPHRLRIADPGAAGAGMQVHDLEAAKAAFVAGGGSVITQGGSVEVDGDRLAIVRDPNGILVELTQPDLRKPVLRDSYVSVIRA